MRDLTPNMQNALARVGETLKALGEQVVAGYFPADHLRTAPVFTARLELEGTTGIQASGATFPEAVIAARRAREEKRAEMEEEAELRAAILAARQQKQAA